MDGKFPQPRIESAYAKQEEDTIIFGFGQGDKHELLNDVWKLKVMKQDNKAIWELIQHPQECNVDTTNALSSGETALILVSPLFIFTIILFCSICCFCCLLQNRSRYFRI